MYMSVYEMLGGCVTFVEAVGSGAVACFSGFVLVVSAPTHK